MRKHVERLRFTDLYDDTDCFEYVVRGPEGAVIFTYYRRWTHDDSKIIREFGKDLSWHSPTSAFSHEAYYDCKYLQGQCYGDGSFSGGQVMYNILQKDGEESLWEELEKEYIETFGEE